MNKRTKKPTAERMVYKIFKKYIVRRDNGQCQVLIPLIELDNLVIRITRLIRHEGFTDGLECGVKMILKSKKTIKG